jgi:hypothetical protein
MKKYTAFGITLFLMLGFFVCSAIAVELTLFGPKKLYRTSGKPDLYTAHFKSLPEQGWLIQGSLFIWNGDLNGKNRVSSADIVVNGHRVITPRDFNQHEVIEIPLLNLKNENWISVTLQGIPGSYLMLQISEVGPPGPIFSGPHQYPFVCRTEKSGLDQPLVDNYDGDGIRVYVEDVQGKKTQEIAGYCKDCRIPSRVEYYYRSNKDGKFYPLVDPNDRPSDLARTTTTEGLTVDYVVRLEIGTINRFIYGLAILDPVNKSRNPIDAWNRKLVYRFDGGVGIGHSQGDFGRDGPLWHDALSRGYAVAYSTGNRTGVHYNLVLAAETAMMVKNHFVKRYGKPEYTIGVGGSGGAIQQYIIGQNHPGLIDAAVPQYSYSDMITQTIYVGDCELLERYFELVAPAQGDFTFGGINLSNFGWLGSVEPRTWIEGLSSNDKMPHPIYSSTYPNPPFNHLGSTECINGWIGLTPLCMNPLWTDVEGLEQLPPDVVAKVKWTHWDDLVNIYGLDKYGYAHNTWDNVGVQYGLQALKEHKITMKQFLDINAKAGGWKSARDMVQEGWPFYGALKPDFSNFDPWSARNMTLTLNEFGVAPRKEGNIEAMNDAYQSGHVFVGHIDIPIVDFRHYLDPVLNMHHSQQSFATRERMIEGKGHAGNQVIWFAEPYYDKTMDAFEILDEWLDNIKNRKFGIGVVANKPTEAVDACFDKDGNVIDSGPNVWDGILNHKPAGTCTKHFPIYSTSRIVAGGDIKGDIFKCHLQSVEKAIRKGVYSPIVIDDATKARLKEIFPDGVCDYTRGDLGRPADWWE